MQADATRLRQVLVNVIGNAIKYNLENGRVDIQVHVRAPAPPVTRRRPERSPIRGRLAIEISDTGRGMTAAQLARLFSAFDRLGLEAGQIEGTGIGLVISRRLIERMGGDIAIDSRPDVGTRVTLTLRRAQGVPLAGARPCRRARGAAARSRRPDRLRRGQPDQRPADAGGHRAAPRLHAAPGGERARRHRHDRPPAPRPRARRPAPARRLGPGGGRMDAHDARC